MNSVIVDIDEVIDDYPDIFDQWVDIITASTGDDFDDTRLEIYYSYGLFIDGEEFNENKIAQDYEENHNLLYEERLEHELSKVKINLTMRYDNFVISNRMNEDYIPDIIVAIVEETTKLKMLIECEYHNLTEIKDSIPELNDDVVSFETIKYLIGEDIEDLEDIKVNLDLNPILEKIHEYGIKSLTKEELDYLNNKSKNI